MTRFAFLLFCISIPGVAGTGHSAGFPEEMAAQPQPSVTQGSAGIVNTEWEGVNGRTYLMQWTQDMVNWHYFPVTEAGAGSKAYGFASSTDKLLLRLECADETPDLAKTAVWQPPLLTVGGEWTVFTRDRNGDPASGVELAFFPWPESAAMPQATALSKARTVANGSCVFDPTSLAPGDRVEVRMTGSPNQRVYLPWQPGRESPDTMIDPGGEGVAITGTLAGRGTGQEPLPGHPANGHDGPDMPVYRLQDFLLMDYQSESYGRRRFPVGFHAVIEEITVAGTTTSVGIETPGDTSNWETPFFLGAASKTGSEVAGIPYSAEFSSAFGNPAIEVGARRSIFVNILDGVWPRVPFPDPVYPPADIIFEDGVVHEWGSEQLPYDPAECPFGDDEGGEEGGGPSPLNAAIPGIFYERQLVLGPVPTYVPLSVMAGGPFYYRQLVDAGEPPGEEGDFNKVRLHAELPLGCLLTSYFSDDPEDPVREVPGKVVWRAVLNGPPGLKMHIYTNQHSTGQPGDDVTLEAAESDAPIMWLDFVDEGAPANPTRENFTVTIIASVKVAQQEFPPGEPGGEYSYGYATYELGSFTTEFIYSNTDRQPGELTGSGQNAPESAGFNGGQRLASIEPERRIGVTGRPAPDSPTFVDALTGRFHHSETDFALPVPGSDLSLTVTRRSSESIWTDAFGLHPSEQALLPHGPGWSGSLAAAVERLSNVSPDGSVGIADPYNPRKLLSRLNVRDYLGGTHAFLEYRDENGETLMLPDPTVLPEPSNSGITLEAGPGHVLTLRQPALGLIHIYQRTGVDFKIANNRDVPTSNDRNPTGFTRYEYYRLTSVTDRFGVRLNYQHGSSPANLVPETISVEGRPGLRIRIRQVDGRVTDFWDPAGVRHTYTYVTHDLAGDGRAPALQSVLASHKLGNLTTASYDYRFYVEADPRPVSMLLAKAGGGTYRIPTLHFALSQISNGRGDAIIVNHRQADVRWAWSETASAYYPVAGDPLLVESITLPGQEEVGFDLQHVLKNAAPGHAAERSIITEVTTLWGDLWRYEFGAAQEFSWTIAEEDAWHLPSASALFFPTLTRSCLDVANSGVEFTYDAAAGFALMETLDAGGRNTAATYDEPFPSLNPLYQRPVVSAGKTLNSRFRLPTTTTDRLVRTTTFDYVENPGNPDHMRVSSITDHRNRVVTPERGVHARTEAIRVDKAGTTLSRIGYAYDTNLPGAVNRIARKALGGAGEPAWVTDLVTNIDLDANGFPERIGNDTVGLHTGYSRSPSGRILEVTAPNGGIRSHQYDSSGLLESTFLEDGSSLTYGRDLAGRIVFRRDAMGNASGIEFDGLGRVTRSVRDMNRNLDFDPAVSLSGVDPAIDIVSSITYLDDTREIHITDPRGFISIRRFDALGRTTKTIVPRNDREPGNPPDENNDRVTVIDYDLLESPDHPVKITDPLGYDTIYRFDSFARLEMILREYGEDESFVKLHAGTGYDYDPATGLLERITAIRTPLDAEGAPLSQDPLETLVTRILRDDLDRPQTTIFADGTAKELRRRTSHTTTGIPYRREIRDALADGATPENWSAWEIICDALGRPEKLTGPTVIDALTGQPGSPCTEYFYGVDGTLHQTGDSYGNLTTYGHDSRGLPSWIKQPAVFDAKSGLTLEPVTTWRRDANGLVTRVVDPLGYAWNHERDAAGRVRTSTGPVVHPAASADRRRPVWHRDFDLAGNLEAITDPEGRIRRFTHYPDNHIESTILPVTFIDETGVSAVQDVTEHYGRDELGRAIRVTDGADQATAFTYDGLHRTLTSTRDPDDSRAKTETTTYDALLALSLQDAAGILREFLYDDQFRLSRIDFSTSPNESLDFGHDLLGRITSIAPVVAPAPGAGDPAVAFHYNALGLLDEETSNGVTTTYGHDLNGRPARITNSATSRVLTTQHDAAGRVYRVVETHGATRETLFGHDLAGNLVREDMPNDCFQETDFDPLGRVTSRRLRENTGPTLCRADYQYDLLANVTRIEESAAHPDIVSRLVENTYNERNQLVTETTTRSGGTLGSAVDTRDVLHRFDPAENRIASDISTAINGIPAATLLRTFDYGDATDGFGSNQLRTLTETPGGDSPTTTYYTYSDNGNRESRTVGTTTDHYTYDSFDRLTGYALNTATSAENGEWQYHYDPLSRRISRSVDDPPTSTRHFAFSSSSPAHEWDDTDVTSHTGGGVGGRLYSRHPSGTHSHPFHNSRGDVMAEFSSAGNLISHTSRDADGLPLDTFGTPTGPYGPNGKWQEPGGLVNDGFRHRDLHTATFLTRDPAGFIDGPNTYNYVGHNPWSAFDPHGLATSLQIPTGTADIGYVGDTSVSGHDPPMISYGPNRDSGTAGSQHPYGYSQGGGPGVTVDPVSDAVGSQPLSLLDNALDAYAWVREISQGYSFGYDYLGGVMGAGYPEDSPPRTPTRAQQRELAERDNSPAYRFGDLFAGMVSFPGKAGAFAINTITMADITSAPLEYDVSRGFYLGENSPHIQLATAGILFLGGPIGRGGSAVVDDALRAGMRSRSFAANTAGRGPVIVGETMSRVTEAARGVPGAKILNDMPTFTGTADQVTSSMMQYNRKWILDQMRSGRPIIDIGTDATRQTPSIFYQMEQNMMQNYQKLNPGSLNISKP